MNLNHVIALGDSIMKGIVTDPTKISEGTIKYMISDNSFVSRCADSMGKPINNLARFGCTIRKGLALLDRHLKEIQSGDAVVLEFGGNDCNFDWKAISDNPEGNHQPITSLQAFHNIYNRIIDRVLSLSAVPVLLSLPVIESRMFFRHVTQGLNSDNILHWLGGDVNYINNWHEQYNLEIFKIGAARRVPVIDITSIFLEKTHLDSYYCSDGMHPNEAGHRLIAEKIVHVMEREGLTLRA